MPLGIKVTTGETSGSAGSSIVTGTAFIIGLADWGVFTPTLVRSAAGYLAAFGERTATSSKLFDAVETFFQLGGERAYIQRCGKEASGEKAKPAAQLKGASHAEQIKVVAKYVGTLGNKLKIEVVENEAKTEYEVLILNEASELLETTGLLKEAKQLVGKSSAWVTYAEGTKFAEGETEKLEKLTAKAFSGGTNPAASITSALAKESLELLPKTLGPGQVLIPSVTGEPTEEATHKLMGEHSEKNNRVALCDLTDSSSSTTLVSNKKTYANNIAAYMEFHSSSCIIPGVTLGTTRTVAGSAVVAGLCAQVAKTENDNLAPAGVTYSLAPFVTGFTNTFSLTQMQTLGENGINAFAERQSKPVLYNFVSAIPVTTDKIFWQFSASRERMHLVWAAEEIAETYLFKQIDGRKQLLGRFQGALGAMLGRQWTLGALYGETAAEGGVVYVGEPINTPTTIAEGQLNAELKVRISPFAESIAITIISSPITEAI